MPTSTRFAVAVHMLTALAVSDGAPLRSEDLAYSVSTGAVVIRGLLSRLSDAGLTAPYDANEYAPGDLIVVDRTTPGVIEEFTATGTPLWRYDLSSGAGELNRPTLARVLPDGNVLVADSGNDRVIVIDHSSKKIIWQYGHTGKSGAAPGYLHTPDSVTLVPRSS